jgi:hypothetical protein
MNVYLKKTMLCRDKSLRYTLNSKSNFNKAQQCKREHDFFTTFFYIGTAESK